MKIVTTRDASHSADQIWRVAAEQFATISDWSSGVMKSSLEGAPGVGGIRTCDLADGSHITETITTYDSANRALTYVVDSGLPPVVQTLENAITLTPLENGQTRITSELTPRMKWWSAPMGPMLKRPFGAAMAGLLDDLITEVGRQGAEQATS